MKGILTHFAEPANEEFSQIQKDRFQQIIHLTCLIPYPLTLSYMRTIPHRLKSWKKIHFSMRCE